MAKWVPRRRCACRSGWGACCSVVAAPLPAYAPPGSLTVQKREVVTADMAGLLCWGLSQQEGVFPAPARKLCGPRSSISWGIPAGRSTRRRLAVAPCSVGGKWWGIAVAFLCPVAGPYYDWIPAPAMQHSIPTAWSCTCGRKA